MTFTLTHRIASAVQRELDNPATDQEELVGCLYSSMPHAWVGNDHFDTSMEKHTHVHSACACSHTTATTVRVVVGNPLAPEDHGVLGGVVAPALAVGDGAVGLGGAGGLGHLFAVDPHRDGGDGGDALQLEGGVEVFEQRAQLALLLCRMGMRLTALFGIADWRCDVSPTK